MPFKARSEGSTCVSIMWRAMSCRPSTQEKVDAAARQHGERMAATGECAGFDGPQKLDYSEVDVVIVMVAPVCTTRQGGAG